jgi:hypothetical protein
MLSFLTFMLERYNDIMGPRFGTVPFSDFVAPQKRQRWLPLSYDARSTNYPRACCPDGEHRSCSQQRRRLRDR